jgi:AcrR family transcriptional regulator
VPKRPLSPAHEERYRQILASAVEVFFARGYAAGTTKEIAERVNLTQPALYYYFGGKDDLLAAIALEVRDRLAAVFEKVESLGGPPEQRLRTLIVDYTAVIVTESRACAVYWDERKHITTDIAKQIQTSQRGFLDTLESLVVHAQRRKRMVAGDPPVIAQAIIGMTSWTYRWYRSGGLASASDIAETYCAMLGL